MSEINKKRKKEEMKLEKNLVDQEAKNNVIYSFWCKEIKFYGFEWGLEGHLKWQNEFIKRAKLRAFAIQFETSKYNYSRKLEKSFRKEIARRLTPEEVIRAVKSEYNNDYALIQFKIIHHELVTNNNPLFDLFEKEIERYKWIGIFHTNHHYKAFRYVLDSFDVEEYNKSLFMCFWSEFGGNKILMRCNETKWRKWVRDYYLKGEKDIASRWKREPEIHPVRRQIKRYTRTYHDPNIFKLPYARNNKRIDY